MECEREMGLTALCCSDTFLATEPSRYGRHPSIHPLLTAVSSESRPNSEEYNYIYLWNDEQTTAAYCTAVHDIIGRFYFRFTWMESTYSEHARSRIVE